MGWMISKRSVERGETNTETSKISSAIRQKKVKSAKFGQISDFRVAIVNGLAS